jgi:hypothetical protein
VSAACIRLVLWKRTAAAVVSAAAMVKLGSAADCFGLLAHLAEERDRPLGLTLARAAEEAVDYELPDQPAIT